MIKLWDIDEIVPVPIHKKRRKKRGYNQAEIIAFKLGELTGIPVNTQGIMRVKNTRPQKELGDTERIKNLENAFEADSLYRASKHVLIIDDIYTTGNTIRHIAQILKASGAEKVFFFTISIGQGI